MSTPPTVPNPTEETSQQRSRYSELEQHELITLLDEVDDERSRARFREAIYISLIIWLVILAFLRYVPGYLLRQPRIVEVPDQKQYTMTELPPDQLRKLIHPHPTNNLAQRNQQSQSPKPAPTQAMPKAGTPPVAPRPEPKPQQQQQAQAAAKAQQQAQQQQQQPQAKTQQQPPPPVQHPVQQPQLADAPPPHPSPSRPNFSSGSMSAGDQIREAARSASRASGASTGGGDYGTGPTRNGGSTGTTILSDTQGVDFSRYLQRLLHDIKRNWDPLIPEECKPPLMKQGITGIRFTIGRDGTITGMNLDYSTHDNAINHSAWGAITSLGQAQPLPPEFHGPNLVLRIEFRVNKDQGPNAQ